MVVEGFDLLVSNITTEVFNMTNSEILSQSIVMLYAILGLEAQQGQWQASTWVYEDCMEFQERCLCIVSSVN